MNWFSRLPIQRKLGYAMLITTMAALMTACGTFLMIEFRSYRSNIQRTVDTLAKLTATNITAAVAFQDQESATQTLEALRAEPQIVSAAIYDAKGEPFASYRSSPDEQLPVNMSTGRLRIDFDESGYALSVQPVAENGRQLGILYMRASLTEIFARMRTYVWMVAGVLLLAFALAGILAIKLGNTLAKPILELAGVANAVATTQNYSLRARVHGSDELTQLTEIFNSMLSTSQATVEALQESEWSHRELVRALPTAAYMCDAEGRITLYNEAAVTLWGRSPDVGSEYWCGSYKFYELDGTPLSADQLPIATALKEGRPIHGQELIIERPDGTRRNVTSYPEPVRDTNGQIVGIVNMLLDITEQKQTMAAMRQLAAIVESSDDAIIGKDIDGIITSWNTGAERLYGYKADEIIGQSVTHLIPPECRDEEPKIIARIRRDERIDQYETVRFRRDGTRVDVSLSVSPIKDASGRIVGAANIARDITSRKRAEQALRSSEAQLRLVTDNAPVLLVRFDRQHRFTFVNRAYANRYGKDTESLIGKKMVEVVGEEAYQAYREYLDTALTGQRVEFEIKICYENLGAHWMHVTYVPERNAEGRVVGLLGVLTDTSERKEAEIKLKRARDEAVAASRAKDDFLAALSHELRTPLNPVLLLASDAAENPELPAEVRAQFELIRKNVNLEAKLIDDLLDLTRIARGKLRLDQHTCDLLVILKDALENAQADLLAKRQKLTVSSSIEKGILLGDSVRLQQVLWNVLKNAVKFTPEGGWIKVDVSALEPKTIVVKVTDSGVGLSPAEINNIFAAFTQGDHAQPGFGSHRFGGLGLGLAISKTLVEMHGGRIYAQSEGRGRGATFVIELPLADDQAALVENGGRGPSSGSPFKAPGYSSADDVAQPLRVLLVEDHAATRQALQHLLKNRGYQVTAAATGAEARQMMRMSEFDLIVSDVGLPDCTGYELMQEFRTLHPGVPGIALSGYGMEEDLARSQAAGFGLHLIKPITIGKLEQAIGRLNLGTSPEKISNS